MGARVIACASSDDKLAFCKERGADEGINYAKEDIKEALRRVTGGKGADVIYDPVGGSYAEAALRSIAWQGRFLVIGFAAGEIPKIPLNLALLKGCDIVGVFWGAFIERDPKGHQANMADLVRFADEGKISAHVHATYPLAQTADALKAIAARTVMGKVILRPDWWRMILSKTGSAFRDHALSVSSSLRFAASRCAGVRWFATMRSAVARIAASSAKPSSGSMSGTASNGSTK